MNETLFLYLKQIKDKYSEAILSIEGVHGIGINMNRERIVVYVDDLTGKALDQIPLELDGVLVEIEGAMRPSITYQPTSGASRRSTTLYRPIPSGVSVGHEEITFGSIGAWVYSPKHNRKGFISNNHVLANENDSRKRQATNVLPVVIQTGTPLIPPVFADTTEWVLDVTAPQITDVTPTNPRVGDVFTINGSHFGNRKGWGQVLLGSVEMPVKSWNSTQIQVYIPDVSPGTYNVKVVVEGDPISQPGRSDGATFPDDFVGELYDFVTLANNVKVDVAFAVVHDESLIDSNVARFDADNLNLTVTATYPSVIPNGIETRLYEQMPIWKTGRRTGTKYGYINNISVDCTVDYGNGLGTLVIKDTFNVISTNSVKYLFLDGGDSGSGTFTADRNEHKQWFLDQGTTQANYVVPAPPMSGEKPNMLIGLCFAGNSSSPSTGFMIKINNIMDETTGLGAMSLAAETTGIIVDFNVSAYTPPSSDRVDFVLASASALFVDLLGNSTLNVQSLVYATNSSTLLGDSTLSAQPTVTNQNSNSFVDLLGDSTLSAQALVITQESYNLAATSSLTINATVTFSASVNIGAKGTLVVFVLGKTKTKNIPLRGEIDRYTHLVGEIDRNTYQVGESDRYAYLIGE